MQPISLTPAQRLIVAADFKPSVYGRDGVSREIETLAKRLEGTGVCLKVNSALRAFGYDLIHVIHSYGLSAFADLKLDDIGETLETEGEFLAFEKPEFLTVKITAGLEGMNKLKVKLPDTEILGVTILTTLNDDNVLEMYDCKVDVAVLRLAEIAERSTIDGLISSPKEASILRKEFGSRFSINTPAVRPSWSIVEGDDQNPDRVMTPAKAITAGADRVVIGRPITQAISPRDAVMWTLDEITEATA